VIPLNLTGWLCCDRAEPIQLTNSILAVIQQPGIITSPTYGSTSFRMSIPGAYTPAPVFWVPSGETFLAARPPVPLFEQQAAEALSAVFTATYGMENCGSTIVPVGGSPYSLGEPTTYTLPYPSENQAVSNGSHLTQSKGDKINPSRSTISWFGLRLVHCRFCCKPSFVAARLHGSEGRHLRHPCNSLHNQQLVGACYVSAT
jgi:hypothetical protein